MSSLELHEVAVSLGGRPLLDAVDLRVADGERLALLGASGAGKTTLLRAIAGLVPLDRGSVELDGIDVAEIEETERGIALVTQGRSLLPHRSVSGNIGFPLEIRRMRRPEVERRVEAQARAFSISELLGRHSRSLSAGESAEVSLARGLVRHSRLLLLDEPFARIGEPARGALIRDVLEMQDGYGATLVVATNDPRIAARLATRVGVLARGTLIQVAPYAQLLARPASLEVAWLVGDGPLNLLPARLMERDGVTVVRAGGLELPSWEPRLRDHVPRAVQLAVRPDELHLDARPGGAAIRGRVERHAFLGASVDVTVTTDDAQLVVRVARPAPTVGSRVDVTVPSSAVHLFDQHGLAIAHGI